MSQRTVIEINHDYWYELEKDPESMKKILRLIDAARPDIDRWGLRVPGIRILGRRHHSEALKLEVK